VNKAAVHTLSHVKGIAAPEIVCAQTAAQYAQLRVLFAELGEWDVAQTKSLGLDPQEVLEFYYASDRGSLPGIFAPPDGCLLLASYSAQPAGCGALRRMSADTCELKRMYVRPEFRQRRIGRQIAGHLIAAAASAGYRVLRLETTTFMDKAIAMYRSLGFQPCQPYYSIPESFRAVTVFMQLNLEESV
jgi:ribosomal protein S18 acetylase RimI-like enzyme